MIIIFIIIKTHILVMNNCTKRFPVRVCTGASCKAWDSKTLIENLRDQSNLGHHNVLIASTKCLNNCGGGVSVQSPLSNGLLKVRDPNGVCEKMFELVLGGENQPLKFDKLENEVDLTSLKDLERNLKIK